VKSFASTVCGLGILLALTVGCFADGTGSGFIVRKDGYIITNHHVVEGAREIWVAVPGKTADLRASVQLDDSLHDLALIKIEGRDYEALDVASSGSVQVMDDVFVFGYPLEDILGTGVSASQMVRSTQFGAAFCKLTRL
jgi:serine protease Do